MKKTILKRLFIKICKILDFEIIDQNNDQEAAIIGTELARDNKIKVLIKGNLHTDTLMRTYLKKEYGLIAGRRLSHIWHMTTPNNNKPLFITDGALNVSPRIEVKMHILSNAVEFAKKIDAPLLANMTEFGKSPYLSVEQFENMGYSIILFPVTVLRAMLKAADSSLRELKLKGTQVDLVDKIMKRSEIYEIINYREFVNIE